MDRPPGEPYRPARDVDDNPSVESATAARSAMHRAMAHVALRASGGPVDPELRVTLNFHPDRLASGVPILEALARDGVYRSQFETGTSNGGLTAYEGGDRWSWESRIFGAAYDQARPAERPKYGSLNFRCRTTGGSPRFGSSHLRLRPETLARTTFCYPDSFLEPEDFGIASVMSLIAPAKADDQDLKRVWHYVARFGFPEMALSCVTATPIGELMTHDNAGPYSWVEWTSEQRERKTRAAWLRGAKEVTGARSTDIRSMRDRAGMAAAVTPVRSAERFLVISWCNFLRRSTMEKNARTSGRSPSKSATKPVSWSSVRTDSVVGISGTSRTSAACMTFSETSEMLGGQW